MIYSTSLDLYEDDEGIAAGLVLECFSQAEIPCVYLETFTTDKYFLSAVESIVNRQEVMHGLLQKEISSYIDKVYKSQDRTFSLTKIYIFPDVADEFGFVFRWPGDIEHGIGVKLSGASVKKVGSTEVAFL